MLTKYVINITTIIAMDIFIVVLCTPYLLLYECAKFPLSSTLNLNSVYV